PYRSVRTSTPSPSSTRRSAALAAGSTASGSSSHATSNASVFSGSCGNSFAATPIRAVPIPLWVTSRTPTAMLQVTTRRTGDEPGRAWLVEFPMVHGHFAPALFAAVCGERFGQVDRPVPAAGASEGYGGVAAGIGPQPGQPGVEEDRQ